jgi:predicted HicB family RNase H-like nuclease
MNVMTCQGYVAGIGYDDADADGLFLGRIVGLSDGVSFQAQTVAGLRAAFRDAVDDYVATCRKLGKTPQTPVRGRIRVRVAPDVHARAAAARRAGQSLATWIEEALRKATASG